MSLHRRRRSTLTIEFEWCAMIAAKPWKQKVSLQAEFLPAALARRPFDRLHNGAAGIELQSGSSTPLASLEAMLPVESLGLCKV
jgi:hypothetical protein